MGENHPKRKKDSLNPYTLSVENGKKYVLFSDSNGKKQKIEITDDIFCAFDRFELDDISYMNEVSRHYEQSELTEQTLYERAWQYTESLEDAAIQRVRNEQLHTAIQKLPDNQRRRLTQYYYCGLTYQQIADLEGCTVMPVKRSIDKALRKLYAMLN